MKKPTRKSVLTMDLTLRMIGIHADPVALEGLTLLILEIGRIGANKFSLRHASKIRTYMESLKQSNKSNDKKSKTRR